MNMAWKIVGLTVALAVLMLLYLFIPPLPAPESLVDRSYSSLIRALGTPDEKVPDKYIMWSVSRMGFRWSIWVSYTKNLESIPEAIHRELWIGPTRHAYPMVRQVAYSPNLANRPLP